MSGYYDFTMCSLQTGISLAGERKVRGLDVFSKNLNTQSAFAAVIYLNINMCNNHINYALQASFTVLLKRGHLKLPIIQCRYALRRNG